MDCCKTAIFILSETKIVTLSEFDKLTEFRKAELVFRENNFILKSVVNCNYFALYSVFDFFVEIKYHPESLKVLYYRSFNRLKPV